VKRKNQSSLRGCLFLNHALKFNVCCYWRVDLFHAVSPLFCSHRALKHSVRGSRSKDDYPHSHPPPPSPPPSFSYFTHSPPPPHPPGVVWEMNTCPHRSHVTPKSILLNPPPSRRQRIHTSDCPDTSCAPRFGFNPAGPMLSSVRGPSARCDTLGVHGCR